MSRRPAVVGLAVAAAVVVNLVVYAVARAAGGSFRFTTPGGGAPAEVDAVTVAGFSAVPLLAGLTVLALLAPVAPWAVRVALIAGPLLAAGTILVMTLPADFEDTTSKVALALCHVTLVPIVVVAVRQIGRRARAVRETRAATV